MAGNARAATAGDDGVAAAAGANGRSGRRRGRPATRQEILIAARALFAERGFAGASIRGIATAASVDPALVHHYFVNKEGLFRAAMEIPVDPEEIVQRIISAGRDEVPRRLVETLVSVWDAPDTGPAMVSLLRRAVAEHGSMDMLRDFLGAVVLRVVARALLGDVPPAEAAPRVALVISQTLGLVMLRKVVVLEPLASMPADRLASAVAPTIAHYLYGDLTQLPIPRPPGADPNGGAGHIPAS